MEPIIQELIDSNENYLKYDIDSYNVKQWKKSVRDKSNTLFLSLEKGNKKIDISKKLVVIEQNLSIKEFQNQIEEIHGSIIYPAWYHQIPIVFCSHLNEKDYFISITKEELHQNLPLLKKKLLTEQTIRLLESDPRTETSYQELYSLETLNDRQKQATVHVDGPIRIIAPAGSGKTKTLINRIAYLKNQGIPDDKILALAFNKKAEEEMNERLEKNFKITEVTVKTFHSFGHDFLKNYLHYEFDETEMKYDMILKKLLEATKTIVTKGIVEQYKAKIREIKNDLIKEEEMQIEKESIKDIFWKLEEKTNQFGIYNYDDMLYKFVSYLIENPVVRNQIGEKYKYILVDEFQDLNNIQLLLLELLSNPWKNVMIVGDDDQMIYGFRGAKLEPIQEWNKYNPCLTHIVLSTNYRSCNNLVTAASKFIKHNNYRFSKNIKAYRKELGEILFYQNQPLMKQAQMIANWIQENKTDKNLYKDFCILYRYNKYRSLITVELDKHQIPYTYEEDKLFATILGKSIIAYIKLVYYELELTKTDWVFITNYPNHYFSKNLKKQIQESGYFLSLEEAKKSLTPLSYKRYQILLDTVNKLKQYPSVTILQFLQVFDLYDFFKYQSHSSIDLSPSDTLEQLIKIINSFTSLQEFYLFFKNQHSKKTQQEDQVILSTIHKTKGNEYSVVIYFNLRKEVKIESIEEERRIIYVGITRAKDKLLVTSEENKYTDLFLKELCRSIK